MARRCVKKGFRYMMDDVVAYDDGNVETQCIKCFEALLIQEGDKMISYVGQDTDGTTDIFGVFCNRCGVDYKNSISNS